MVFVTGGTGLVGGHLLIHLLKHNTAIRALRRKSSNFSELKLICASYQMDFDQVMSRIQWVTGDLSNKESLTTALEGVSIVYHCAAIVSFGNTSPEELKHINIKGTYNLTKAALEQQVSCFAFVSSIGALGQSQNGEVITEDTPWNTENTSSVYSNSKYAAEQEVWKLSTEGIPVVIVNPGIILGAGDFSKGSLQLFAQVQKGIPFYTCQKTGYVDVRDVCTAMITLVEQKIYNHRFILVSENMSNKTLFILMAKASGRRSPFISIGRRGLMFTQKVDTLISRLSGRPNLLTPEIRSSALKQESYSSEKIQQTLNFSFIPIKESIESSIYFNFEYQKKKSYKTNT